MKNRERMGPGGLRGLQILRSDVKSARGGFDSHAFPPLWSLFLATLIMVVGAPAGAYGDPSEVHATGAREGWPSIAAADSIPVPQAPADTLSRGRGDSLAAPTPVLRPHQLQGAQPQITARADSVPARRKPSRFEQPRWVMARSLLIPGWGQFHNKSWIKAAGIAAGEIWLAYRLVDDRKKLDRLEQQVVAARAAGDEEREFLLVDDYNGTLDRYTSRQWVLGGLVTFALLDAYIDAHFRGFNVEFEGDPALPTGKSEGSKLRLSLRRAF